MSSFHYVFAGLPPCFFDRYNLQSDTLFESQNGSILHEARDDYIHDTERFRQISWSPSPHVSEVISLLCLLEKLTLHMNSSQRAEKLQQYAMSYISSGNTEHINALKQGISWGLNAMFPIAKQPLRAKSQSEQDTHTQIYQTMIATIEYLNDEAFTLSPTNDTEPFRQSDVKYRLVKRSSGSCELSGARFLSRSMRGSAANCLEAHIIPSNMCMFNDEGSGVFTWLVIAILLSKDQFDSIWGECVTGNANNPKNLLLLLDEIELSYGSAEFKLAYCCRKDARRPLLRCDYNTAVHDRERLMMGFEWLIPTRHTTHWAARRVSDEDHSILPCWEHLAVVRPDRPTMIHYVNHDSMLTENPSPLLLDAHNVIASLFVMTENLMDRPRCSFPLDNTIWYLFRRMHQSSSRSNSRQRSYASTSSTHSWQSLSSRQRNSYGSSQNYTTNHGDESTTASGSSLEDAIENYLKTREGLPWADQVGKELNYHSGFDKSTFMSLLRNEVIIPTWIDNLP